MSHLLAAWTLRSPTPNTDATHGRHDFFQEEKGRIKDVRETPIKFASYAISHRGGHAHVRIERETYRDLKGFLLDHATRRSTEWLERVFSELPFEPYAPIRRQLVTLWKRVNEARGSPKWSSSRWAA